MKKTIYVPTAQVIKLLKRVKEGGKKEDIVNLVIFGFLLTAAQDLMLKRQLVYI